VLTPRRIQVPLHGTSFFPASVFMVFDGDGFILQMQRGFTRIRSGLLRRQAAAARVDQRPKAQGQCAQAADSWLDLFRMAANAGDEKP
jgi:hypothetical protein